MTTLVFGAGSDITPFLHVEGSLVLCGRVCDVTDYEQVEKAVSMMRPDHVINLAAVSHLGTVGRQDRKLWISQIVTNLIGSYHIARACVRHKVKRIVFVASVAGKYGKPNHSAYSASKAGVISLVQSLSLEGVDAYCVSPGRIDTKMRDRDYPDEDRDTRLTPQDVAAVIVECLEGKYKRGSNIIVNKRGKRKMKRVDAGEPWRRYLNYQPFVQK